MLRAAQLRRVAPRLSTTRLVGSCQDVRLFAASATAGVDGQVAAAGAAVAAPELERRPSSAEGSRRFWQRRPPTRERWIVELTDTASLLVDPQVDAEVAAELPVGELLEAFADVGAEAPEWLLVRAPLEENPNSMSDKPLEYREGWLRNPSVRLAKYQPGDTITARIESPSHPMFDLLRLLPPWRGDANLPLPQVVREGLSELYVGKVGGVVLRGRFVVQRPSGAIPERVCAGPDTLLTSRERARGTALAGLLGFALAAAVGTGAHVRGWIQGEPVETGRNAWPQLVGWLTIVSLFLAPISTVPCYYFHNSLGSTAVAVAAINLLFYDDLFSE